MRNKIDVKKNAWLGACLLALGVPFSQAWAYTQPQWRPVVPKEMAQLPVQYPPQQQLPMAPEYARFRSVQASVAVPHSLPQPPQPVLPVPATTPYNQPYAQAMAAYPWSPQLMRHQMPMQPPVVPIPPQQVYQVQHKVAVVPPSVAMRSPDNNKWRPVMPKVAAKPQVYAQTANYAWRPAVAQVQRPYHAPTASPASPNVAAVAPQPVAYQPQPYMATAYPAAPQQHYYYPQHYQHYPTTYLPTWSQGQFAQQQHYMPAMPQFPAPVPVPQPQLATQPWWWQQGQQWKTYPHAKPWPGQKEKIVADYPASVCAGCKT